MKVVSAMYFANVNNNGNANYNNASNVNGVRPDSTTAHYLDKIPQCGNGEGKVVLSGGSLINTNHDGSGYDR